jgi:hypothetical protein
MLFFNIFIYYYNFNYFDDIIFIVYTQFMQISAWFSAKRIAESHEPPALIWQKLKIP